MIHGSNTNPAPLPPPSFLVVEQKQAIQQNHSKKATRTFAAPEKDLGEEE